MTDDPDKPTSAAWYPVALANFMDHAGPLMARTSADGVVSYGLVLRAAHMNRNDTVHGGLIASLLDQVLSTAARTASGERPLATIQLDSRFLGTACTGAFVEATGRVTHQTRSLIFTEGEIICEGSRIADATAILELSRPAG